MMISTIINTNNNNKNGHEDAVRCALLRLSRRLFAFFFLQPGPVLRRGSRGSRAEKSTERAERGFRARLNRKRGGGLAVRCRAGRERDVQIPYMEVNRAHLPAPLLAWPASPLAFILRKLFFLSPARPSSPSPPTLISSHHPVLHVHLALTPDP